MAYYATLIQLVQLLEDISHHNQYSSSLLDKQQIASLYEKFSLLQELLEEYSPKDEEVADCLERRIREATYLVQDIVESNISNQICRVKGIFRHLIPGFRKAPRQLQNLEKAKEEVDSIVEELRRIKVKSHTIHEDSQLNTDISADSSRGESIVQAPGGRNIMVGFEEHLMTIKGHLCGESRELEVISIVGMGGLGKSTLARNIFDDKLVDDYFDCRAWVTVSQDYHIENTLLAIVDSLNIKVSELSEAQEHIYKHLKGRRYLIVMDDMWEIKVWDDVKRIFPNDYNGSRLILTTRLLDVAAYASKVGLILQLPFLSEDQSWNLFCNKVFCPPELEDIARLVAKNCRGLPLAIVVVAGLLYKVNKTRHDWEEIARNVISTAVDQDNEHFTKILSLSYNHLPHHLKPCFLYLGGFPEDWVIRVSRLIWLWAAEGFLKPTASKSSEEVGEEYFKDLVNRNLVLITKKTSDGKFKYCSIHDLLRDLCSQKAHSENFLHCLHEEDYLRQEPIGNLRRLSIQTWDDSLFRILKEKHVSHVRAITFFAARSSFSHYFLSVASDFNLLRVLDTERVRRFDFTNALVELLHLRYLSLQNTITSITPRIFKLQNLQTLIFRGSASLPSEIWKMPQLRHILVSGDFTLPAIPYGEIRIIDGVPLLGRLHTLQKVKDFKFTIDTIEMIPNLKKLKLEYSYRKRRGIWEEFGLNNFVHLHQLETLGIDFIKNLVPMSLTENFAFPSALIKLTLMGCRLPWKDMTVVGLLPNLQVLKLRWRSFEGEEWEPIEGEFPRLKFLLMDLLVDLRYWRVENTHFPCLEQLHIKGCLRLKEIPLGIGDISTLQLIQLVRNSALKSSALKIQEEQRDLGNDDLQVRIIRS